MEGRTDMDHSNMRPAAYLTNKKTTLEIPSLPAKFGRNDNAVDVYYFHESISREHCLFDCINRRFTVMDLNSTVGTYINGVRLDPNVPYNIDEGMKLTFGKVKFVFHPDYEELARREASREPAYVPPAPRMDSGIQASSQGGAKRVAVSAKELSEYEYDESEVVMIECGLAPEEKPLSYTSEIRKMELEARLREEEAKKTQAVSVDELEEARAEAEAEAKVQAEEAAEAAADPEAEEQVEAEVEAEAAPAAEGPVETGAEEESGEIEESADEETLKEEPEKELVLRWVDDETGESQKLSINYFPFRIGRKSDENDYQVRKKGVSRTHLIFDSRDGSFFVRDDDSTNGVKVNGKKIDPGMDVRIVSGDSIRIAGITFKVREE